METYVRRKHVVEAKQWFKLGDHHGVKALSEPLETEKACRLCGKLADEHGYFGYGKYGCIVCPGDWIVYTGYYYEIWHPRQFEESFVNIDEVKS